MQRTPRYNKVKDFPPIRDQKHEDRVEMQPLCMRSLMLEALRDLRGVFEAGREAM